MRKLLGLVLLLSLATTLAAQTTFELAGQTIQPPKNACQICRGKKKAIKALGEPLAGRYYLIAQFKEIPNQDALKKLAEQAVHRLHLIAIDILAERVWLEKYRSTWILLLQCIFERQMRLRFCRRWNIAVIWM